MLLSKMTCVHESVNITRNLMIINNPKYLFLHNVLSKNSFHITTYWTTFTDTDISMTGQYQLIISANQYISWALMLMNDGALVESKDNCLKSMYDVEVTG